MLDTLPPELRSEAAEYIDAALDFDYDGVAACYYNDIAKRFE